MPSSPRKSRRTVVTVSRSSICHAASAATSSPARRSHPRPRRASRLRTIDQRINAASGSARMATRNHRQQHYGAYLGDVQVANAILRGGAGDGTVVTALERGRAGAAYTFVPRHDPSTGFTYRYTDEVVDHPSFGRLAVLVPTGERWGYSPSRSRSPERESETSVD